MKTQDLYYGTLDFGFYSYDWNSNLPVPKENFVLRFKWYQNGVKLSALEGAQLFIPRQHSKNQLNLQFMYDTQQLNASITTDGNNVHFRPNYTQSKYCDLGEESKYATWYALYFTKDKVEFYQDGVLTGSQNGSFNLKYFSGAKYYIGTRSQTLGIIYHLDIIQDVDQQQFKNAVKGKTFLICNGHVQNNLCCPSISDVKMTGSGVYGVETGSYQFTFKSTDIKQAKCIQGYIQDSQRNTIDYSGQITDATFIFPKEQVQKQCHIQFQQQICKFKYQIQNLNYTKINFEVTTKFSPQYSVDGHLKTSNKLQLQEKDTLSYTINKKYTITASYKKFQKKIVFFNSPQFKYTTNSYQNGDLLFAQLQVDQKILGQGQSIQFYKATLNKKKIQPFDMFYSNEGYLNLSFNPNNYISKIKPNIDLNIEFELIDENTISEIFIKE